MPIYEYKCDGCGEVFELLQRMSDPPPEKHEACGSQAVHKIMSAGAFVFKGEGWYVTDYARKDQAQKKARASGESSKHSSKEASKDTAQESTKDASASSSDSSSKTEAPAKPTESSASKDKSSSASSASKPAAA